MSKKSRGKLMRKQKYKIEFKRARKRERGTREDIKIEEERQRE